jgi:hypothetical protein
MRRSRALIAGLVLVAMPLLGAAKCSTQSAWGKASAGRHATTSGGVLIRISSITRNGKTIARWAGAGVAVTGGLIIANAARNAIQQKDPCISQPPAYVVARFRSKKNSQPVYLDCRILYPMMKSGAPYNQLSFSISCIARIIATGNYTVNLPSTERWQSGHMHVVAAIHSARIERYRCI